VSNITGDADSASSTFELLSLLLTGYPRIRFALYGLSMSRIASKSWTRSEWCPDGKVRVRRDSAAIAEGIRYELTNLTRRTECKEFPITVPARAGSRDP